jgi:hypothetical protein
MTAVGDHEPERQRRQLFVIHVTVKIAYFLYCLGDVDPLPSPDRRFGPIKCDQHHEMVKERDSSGNPGPIAGTRDAGIIEARNYTPTGSTRRRRALHHFEIVGSATSHPIPSDRAVKGDQSPVQRSSEAQKIKIRNYF